MWVLMEHMPAIVSNLLQVVISIFEIETLLKMWKIAIVHIDVVASYQD